MSENKYLKKRKEKKIMKKSRFDTGPIDVIEEEHEIEKSILDEIDQSPTFAESFPNSSKNKDNQQLKRTTSLNRSIFSNKQFNETTNEENFELKSKSSNWDSAKLMKLKEKLIDTTYLSSSFFTDLANTYNILDFYSCFSKKSSKNIRELLKELITKTTPVIINTNLEVELKDNIRKIFALMQTSRADYGVSALKIGWPFAIGGFKENNTNQIKDNRELNINWNDSSYVSSNTKESDYKYFYSPLLLWPIKLHTRDRRIFNIELLRKHSQIIVEVNTAIILSLVHNNNYFENNDVYKLSVDSFVNVLYDENIDNFMGNIIKKYESFGIKFNDQASSELKKILQNFEVEKLFKVNQNKSSFKEEINTLFSRQKHDEIKVLPYATIGIYPIANIALYMDYVKMIQSDGVGFVSKIDNIFYNQLELAEEYHKYFSETSLKEIVKLDFSQKKACNVALNDNLIISGAAGNGKSQTISSIIANAINNSKSVLFSTEKKEAANVIFNRLGRLRNYSLKLFESDNFAKEITTQLKNGLERVSLVYGIRNSIKATNTSVISEKLDVICKKVNDFKTVMMSEEGQNYPEYIFKKNKMKDILKEVIHLVGPILKKSETSSDFWMTINKINDDYTEYQQISKVKENLGINDDLFTHVFELIKYYDGNDLFYDNYLIQYANVKKVNLNFETLPEDKVKEFLADAQNVRLEDYAIDKKALYWSLHRLFQGLDDYSIDILKSHDLHWYNTVSNNVKQKSTEQIVEFRSKYSPEEFDYEFFHDYYAMEKFAADHGDIFQVDNENYYEIIDNLITNKLGEDIKTTEFMFALKVAEILKENQQLAQSFNKLYALIKNTDVLYSIDDVLVNYSNIISLIFPLVLGSPNMIAKYIVCQSEIFDVCIIDEASMIPLEDAFSLLYRCSQWIVSGDIKQLPPASYQKNIEKYNKYQMMYAENTKTDVELDEVMKYKIFETPISLLEYIGTKIQTVVLEYHYRSIKKELFEFSNIVFYKKRIHVADDQKEKDKSYSSGINLIRTNGIYENGVNKKEAEEIVKLVEKIVNQPNHGSIGIITTTNEQRDYIENLLLEHPSKLVTNEFARISEDGEDESIFVLTCEKVQGSERDNIIISFVASHDAKNTENILSINNILGLLATEVGPNYLNVLITRSRQALFLFNSFKNEEIIAENNQSLIILKDYLEYAELLTNNGHDLNDPRVQAIFKPYIKNNAVIDFSNDMRGRATSRIAAEIKEDLLQVFAFEPRLEILDGWFEGDVKIDLVIRDKKTKRNIMGILCDEFIYDVMLNGKQRDYYNRKFLETRNWKFFSLSSLQWSKIYKRREIIGKIINMLTLHLNSWTNALRITQIKKYQVDENGNVIIVDNIIKNAKNRLETIEVEKPLYYEGDELLVDSSVDSKEKKSKTKSKRKQKEGNSKNKTNKVLKLTNDNKKSTSKKKVQKTKIAINDKKTLTKNKTSKSIKKNKKEAKR